MSRTTNKLTDSRFWVKSHIYRSDEVSIIDLIVILWKGKYIVLFCIIIASILGIVYALNAPEVFTSSSHFIIKTGRNSVNASLNQLATLAGINVGAGSGIDPSMYIDKILQDQNFLSALFERKWAFKKDSLSLEKILAIEIDTSKPDWQHAYHMNKINAIREQNIINVTRDLKTGILNLHTNAPDPQLAHDLNKFAIDFISDYIRHSLKTQAKEKRLFIDARLKDVKVDLEKSENNLMRFKERNLMSTSAQVLIEEARLTRQVTINQELFLQLQKQFELTKIEELDDQTLIQVVKSPEVPVKKSKPKRSLLVVISSLCGFFLGVLILFFKLTLAAIKNAQSINKSTAVGL